MSWEDILKDQPKTRHFLLEVFNIPVNVPLNISITFLQRFQAPSYENVITEQRFEILMELSRQEKYQQIIDLINKWLDEQRKKNRAEYRETVAVRENRPKLVKKGEE